MDSRQDKTFSFAIRPNRLWALLASYLEEGIFLFSTTPGRSLELT
jgi:hypothetical protein